ncbi:MAG: hypothetical protein RR512_06090 [Coprobacillus sp.]
MIIGILICLFLLLPDLLLQIQDKMKTHDSIYMLKLKIGFWSIQWMKIVIITLNMSKFSDGLAIMSCVLLCISNIVFIYMAIRYGLKSMLRYTTIVGFIALFTEIISCL